MTEEKEYKIPAYRGKVKPAFLARAKEALGKYKADKGALEARVSENNKWYKAQYWKMIHPMTNEPQPATAFIFNAIENKYADAVDNFPVPNLLEREPGDSDAAKILSKIIPVQLDMAGFKSVYKDNWRRKLKHGTAIYGVFYNEDKDDIDVEAIDLLNVYCDMHLKDVQDSPFLFISSMADNDVLKDQYPKMGALFQKGAELKTYSGTYKIEGKTEVVDCYYKKRIKGKTVLHMMKLAGGHILEATEDMKGYEKGIYSHGMYPVVFDALYPEEDSPFGFGIIDVVKNPQIYVDKLDSIISKNAMIAGKIRYMIKDNGGVNEKELQDYSLDVIHVAGGLDEANVRQFQADALDPFIVQHRQNKINELKEVIGNRDFQQGATSGGVTAAAAITVLQQSGEKLSRAMINDSYDAYKNVVTMVIEVIREYYDKERIYRITNENGQVEYAKFDNSMIKKPQVKTDALGLEVNTEYKNVMFDISVVPQRQNPFSKEANNQTITTLWQMGLFQPQSLEMALIMLQAMQFDGKDKLISDLQEFQQKAQNQQGQEMQQVAQQLQQQMQQQLQQQSQQVGQQLQQLTQQIQMLMQTQQAMQTAMQQTTPPAQTMQNAPGALPAGMRDAGNGMTEVDLGMLQQMQGGMLNAQGVPQGGQPGGRPDEREILRSFLEQKMQREGANQRVPQEGQPSGRPDEREILRSFLEQKMQKEGENQSASQEGKQAKRGMKKGAEKKQEGRARGIRKLGNGMTEIDLS